MIFFCSVLHFMALLSHDFDARVVVCMTVLDNYQTMTTWSIGLAPRHLFSPRPRCCSSSLLTLDCWVKLPANAYAATCQNGRSSKRMAEILFQKIPIISFFFLKKLVPAQMGERGRCYESIKWNCLFKNVSDLKASTFAPWTFWLRTLFNKETVIVNAALKSTYVTERSVTSLIMLQT